MLKAPLFSAYTDFEKLWNRTPQPLQNVAPLLSDFRRLKVEFIEYGLRIEVKLMYKEIIRGQERDVVGRQYLCRKIPHILSDDCVRVGMDCQGDNVPVTLIR